MRDPARRKLEARFRRCPMCSWAAAGPRAASTLPRTSSCATVIEPGIRVQQPTAAPRTWARPTDWCGAHPPTCELSGALGIALLGSLGTAIYRHDIADQVPSRTAAAVRDTFAGAVDTAHSAPAGVLAAANDAFLGGLEVVAATGAVLICLVAAVAVDTLRHVGRPDTGEPAPSRPSSLRRSRPRPPSLIGLHVLSTLGCRELLMA
jgi:hypothetical protein